MVETDYYELLQVERGADDKAIKSAYRKLAMECHPDRNGGCIDSEARFKAISEAYECLKDPQKRAAYDRFGHAAFRQNGFGGGSNGGAQDFGSFSDIFENIFGEFMNNGQGDGRRNAMRGSDLCRPPGRDRHRHHRPLRALRRQRRQAGHLGAQLQRLRRPRPGPRAPGLLRHRADLPDVPRRRPGDLRSVRQLPRRGPGREEPVAPGQHPGRSRRRHPNPPLG
jgi:curved DNA-binding protein CbpA